MPQLPDLPESGVAAFGAYGFLVIIVRLLTPWLLDRIDKRWEERAAIERERRMDVSNRISALEVSLAEWRERAHSAELRLAAYQQKFGDLDAPTT